MPDLTVHARPRKWFFVEMFTRDISLSECILDLIDNALDGLIRSGRVDLEKDFFDPLLPVYNSSKEHLPEIEIRYDHKQLVVKDSCGGIPFEFAQTEAFNFGQHYDESRKSPRKSLGVYGVGLKRALFKIGDSFEISSKTQNDGFIVKLKSIKEWMKLDNDLDDWCFPISKTSSAKGENDTGTTILITQLTKEVQTALADGLFLGLLIKDIGLTYALFLDRYVKVIVNGDPVKPMSIPFGFSEEIEPAHKSFAHDKVHVDLFASIAARTGRNEWTAEQAGWYVACNGRLVVSADKTVLTGWASGTMPQFHTKYRGFVGLALFQSDDPMLLPWRTNKRGLNQESLVYQQVRNQMRVIARPVLSFLDKMYPSEPREALAQREMAESVSAVDVRKLMNSKASDFEIRPKKKQSRQDVVRIQYDAQLLDVELIRKHIRNSTLGANKVGLLTFEEYLREKGLK